MQIFITGISSGIGRELSKQLVAAGNEVWGVARRHNLLEKLSREIESNSFHCTRCDVTNSAEVKDVHQRMQMTNFFPDVVILNAGIYKKDIYPHFSEELFTETLRVNVAGALVWVSLFIEPFLRRGSGQFIAISSMFAKWPDQLMVPYSASKASLSMAFRGLRLRYAKSNIHFKTAYLGPVGTQINSCLKENPSNKPLSLIKSSQDTARYLIKIISSRRLDFYYPFYIMLLFNTLCWLPDNIFKYLTHRFRR
ncbi:SDR family NAD(P)-dependent oxidoreductase [Thermodesulfobacteriota bacterium]